MRLITKKEDFESIDFAISAAVDRQKKIPESVFIRHFGSFLFFAFDKLFTKDFFRKISEFVRGSGEHIFWISVIDPNPKMYFFENFLHYGALECSIDDSDEDYVCALNADPGGSPADALIHNSNSIVVTSPSVDWIIFGDRAADIAVCAFRDISRKKAFFAICEPILFLNVAAAADFAYDSERHALEEYEKFVAAYTAGNGNA